MSDTVEVCAWEDRECTKQIVEFDLSEDVCHDLDVFLQAVNDYLVSKDYIPSKVSEPLANLEYSEVSAITSSKDIIYSYYKKDNATGLMELVESNFRAFGVYSRK